MHLQKPFNEKALDYLKALISQKQGILFNRIQLVRSKASDILNTSDIETNEKSVFTKRTIGQLLFDGFPIKIFEKIEEFIEDTHKFAPFIKLIKLNPFRISDKVSHMHSFL